MRSFPNKQQPHQAHQRWQAGQKAEKAHRWAEALQAYRQAADLAPNDALYRMNAANMHLQLNQHAQALSAAQQAQALAPDQALPHQLLALTLTNLHRHSEAANVWRDMPASVPRDAAYYSGWSRALLLAERWQDAVQPCLQLLQHDMFNATAHLQLGMAMVRLNRPSDAALCFETAAATDKSGDTKALALSQLIDQLRYAAKWDKLPQHTEQFLQALDTSTDAVLAQIIAFSLVAIEATPLQQLRVARLSSARVSQGITPLPARSTRQPGPLRLAYLSNDFHEHATALLMAGMLEAHDRQHVEVHLFCHSKVDHSSLQQRVRAAAHHFHDVRHLSNAEVAHLMRAQGIDIAIDLKGQTTGSRFQILAYRPAPIQVNFLGFPGSSGATFLDYVIGDPTVIPLTHAEHFSECIAQMPTCYQPNDPQRDLLPSPTRTEVGLPEDAVVLCCFNQIYKLSPDVADAWAEIMRATPNTVLWLLIWNEQAAANLTREMQARGIAPERLFFSPKTSAQANQARLQCADLFLDTWPCNAHTTASDALWSGVPVLTWTGTTFASRVASSLVRACGLPALACDSRANYVSQAIALSQDRAALQAMQTHLRSQHGTLPLFDVQTYTREFEALLQRMWQRHEAGLPPAHLLAQADTRQEACA